MINNENCLNKTLLTMVIVIWIMLNWTFFYISNINIKLLWKCWFSPSTSNNDNVKTGTFIIWQFCKVNKLIRGKLTKPEINLLGKLKRFTFLNLVHSTQVYQLKWRQSLAFIIRLLLWQKTLDAIKSKCTDYSWLDWYKLIQ